MSDEKPKRKRIPIVETIMTDPESYTANSCSQNAKHFSIHLEEINVELWIDKHCTGRQVEREGIDINVLETLTKNALQHIFYYQKRYQVKLIQYPEYRGSQYRIIIQQETDSGELLNLVVEVHFVDINLYEVTLVTAMVENNFRIIDGQYILIMDGESSILKRRQRGGFIEVANFGIS